MSDIFENDIADENDSLSNLEDEVQETGDFVSDKPLYHLKLEYSNESIYAKIQGPKLEAGDYAVVPTRYGKDLAKVLGIAQKPIVKSSDVVQVERKATSEDIEKMESLKQKERDAFPIFREKVENHKLDMKLIQTHFLFDDSKALFFFTSDNRVDFRELVKDLVSVFKMRIELRQIGVRDEARITGGLGVCGRPLCCNSISDKLRSVSIKMAKEQNLSLNSMKISGQCGRLLCCLANEYDWYNEARRCLPNEGLHIHYDGTNFRITEINPVTSMIKMLGEDGRLLEVNAKRFVKENGRWVIN